MKLLPYFLTLATIVMVGTSHVTLAETLEVEYKRFYSHTKKLNNEDTQDLQFAFGFINVRKPGVLCTVHSAEVVTQKVTLPLNVSPEYRFTVPTEKALKLAEAKIRIDLAENANQCDMSVQLETTKALLKTTYNTSELNNIYQQYSAFFNAMGSFMSFMMPSVEGINFQFSDPNLDIVINNDLRIEQGMLRIKKPQLAQLKQLNLPVKPLRITALTAK
ncbi:DUF2987 domain-containing protein [Opacimonas viscosa]|uniref:DUF2987 domain-containing protein n=1 Tax=Opacimonas viscosa TaxID=2961944 RepID=A0AA41X047_9ALTE|nr:DUF2987 domain-containing protein [Opacimonas viscosa]MCP3427457.1 DUF2987 domain-containing protein [Opacimonas viscosa]